MARLTLPQLERHLLAAADLLRGKRVVHERVHLREPHHAPGFWRAVERVPPAFALRKQWRAEHGAKVGAS